MLMDMFILILVLSVIFLILSIVWESLMISIIDVILWLILSISIYKLEIPYQAIQNDNTIVTGFHSIETLYPLSYLFMGISLLMMMYMFICIIFPMLQGKFSRMM